MMTGLQKEEENMKLKFLVVIAVLLAASMVACDRNEAEITPEPAQTQVEEATEPTELTAQMWIDDPTLGSTLNEEGRVMLGAADNDFVAGDTIYYAMEVGDAPANASVTVMWYGPESTKLSEETKTVTAGEDYMHFQAPDTSAWAVGDYRVELHTEGQLVHSEDFNIEEGE